MVGSPAKPGVSNHEAAESRASSFETRRKMAALLRMREQDFSDG
jgi:hypothetical protein